MIQSLRKLMVLVAVVLLGIGATVNAQKLYVFGSFNNWTPADAIEMTYANGVYSAEGIEFGADGNFALSTVKSSDWNTVNANRYGFAQDNAIATNGVAMPIVKGQGAMKVPEAGVYTIVANLSAMTVTVTKTSAAVIPVPDNLFIIGHIDGTNFEPENGIEMEQTGENIYSVKGTVDDCGDGHGYFAFATIIGTWDDVNSGTRYGAESKDLDIALDNPANIAVSENSWKAPAGEYIFTADFNNFTVTISEVPVVEEPIATFTFVPDGTSQAEIAIMGTAAGQKVVIDWGNGVKSDSIAIGDPDVDWSAISILGTPAGDGIVKLYGKAEQIGQLDCSWATGQLKMQAIDVTKLTAVTSLSVVSHEISTIDISKNTAVTTLNLANNKLAALDLRNNTAIKSFNASNSATLGENRLQGIDLSPLTAATTINLSYNEITSIDVSANTAVTTLNLTGNKLETLDLTGLTSAKTLNLNDNNLSSITYPASFPAKTYIYLLRNKFKLSTLPVQPENVTRYNYAPQQAVEIAVVDGKVDLSTEVMVNGNATVFTWYNNNSTLLVEGTDYTAENGVFSFLTQQTGAYATMSNASFASFVDANILKTTAIDITETGIEQIEGAETAAPVYYNLQGVEVSNPDNGLYIVKRGNKVAKEFLVK